MPQPTRLKAFPDETHLEAENLYNTIHQMIHAPGLIQQMIDNGDFK